MSFCAMNKSACLYLSDPIEITGFDLLLKSLLYLCASLDAQPCYEVTMAVTKSRRKASRASVFPLRGNQGEWLPGEWMVPARRLRA